MYTELQMIKEALQKYQSLIKAGFSKSTYIISEIAVAYHNIRGPGFCLFVSVCFLTAEEEMFTYVISVSDIDQALAMFHELRNQDPFRIDNMDTFSNLLYVKVILNLRRIKIEGLFFFVLMVTIVSTEHEARAELLGP